MMATGNNSKQSTPFPGDVKKASPGTKLAAFLLLSVAIHLGFIYWPTSASKSPVIAQQQASVTVQLQYLAPVDNNAPDTSSLEDVSSPASEPQTATTHQTEVVRTDSSSPTLVPISDPEKVTPLKVQNKSSALVAKPETLTTTKSSRSRILAILQADLARHFKYPPLAKRRGWQGKVILSFHLETDGAISQARVTHSSGYGMLDIAALKSLNKVTRINAAQELLSGESMDFDLPVIYQIKEG
ncbi:MAG: energy transducer TonB [Gammaproteobacteria bacterium]|nr:energy transducer TonB [Gammaproteobacteria bacterium]